MPYCSTCGEEFQGAGTSCASCVPSTIVPAAPPSNQDVARLRERIATQRHGFPAFLSFLIPGLGQMVKGRFLHGVAVWIVLLACGVVCGLSAPVGLVALLIAWIAQLQRRVMRVLTPRCSPNSNG